LKSFQITKIFDGMHNAIVSDRPYFLCRRNCQSAHRWH